jgi:hypothetical protein
MRRINEMGFMEGGGWEWDLLWRRDFFAWEEPIVQDLMAVIHGFSPTENEDRWIWKPDPANGITVKSYEYLDVMGRGTNNNHTDVVTNGELFRRYVFSKIWKSAAPSKVCAFSWQLLLQRIPTRDNLRIRGVDMEANTRCPLCGNHEETEIHLFLHCNVATSVWYRICQWLSQVVVIPPDLLHSFAVFIGCGVGKKGRKGMMVIWHAVMWCIWRMRNDVIFNNGTVDVNQLVDDIKRISWQWFIGRLAAGPCLLYEWCWSPENCFSR